jgi:hypothetical protein
MTSWHVMAFAMMMMPSLVIVSAVFVMRWLRAKEARRDPLTSELLALPGAQLQQKVASSNEDLGIRYLAGVLTCTLLGEIILLRHISVDISALNTHDYVFLVGSLAAAGWTCWEMVRVVRAKRTFFQGLRAEMATAQEVTAALMGNQRLLNDVVGDGFNIDHVVVSPAGVFAIETKSRRKLAVGNGSPKVSYDGKSLKFTDWTETEPLTQAARQAQWLRGYLQKATGQSYAVQPVLALPGWFVEQTARLGPNDVRVINPKNSGWLFTSKGAPVLTDAQIQQAIFMLEKIAKSPDLY